MATKHNTKNTEVEMACELCGKPTNIRMRLGDLPDKVPNLLDRKQTTYKHGMCAGCKKDLEEGCVIFVDAKERCIKVNPEAAKEKISPAFIGKIVKIPIGAMNELIKVWIETHPLPPLDGQS